MVALASLRPASFRGARFLVPEDSAEEGRNTILHKYPDSNRRYAEDNGYCPPQFKLTCILHGNDCLSQFNRLRSALNRKGPGTLNHPYYGAQLCAVVGPWTVSRTDQDSGVLKVEVNFAVTSGAIFPGALLGGMAAQITGLSSAFVGSAFAALGAGLRDLTSLSSVSLSVFQGVIGSTVAAFSALGSVAAVVGSSLRLTSSVADAIAHTSAPVYAQSPIGIIREPTDLATELQTLFRAPFEDLTYSGADIAAVFEKVDDAAVAAASEAALLPTSTTDYALRREATITYSLFVRAAALSSLCEALAGTTYATADQVVDAQGLLIERYEALPLDALSHDLGQSLTEVVSATLGVLANIELQLPRIEQIRVHDMPASVLAYLLYEDEARISTIADLNSGTNPILLDGSINILSQAD